MPQSLSQLYVHLIFSTKHREPMLLSPLREGLHAYLAAALNNQESPALKVGGMADHVHALFRLSKNIALAKIVEEVKTSSSKPLQGSGVYGGFADPGRWLGLRYFAPLGLKGIGKRYLAPFLPHSTPWAKPQAWTTK